MSFAIVESRRPDWAVSPTAAHEAVVKGLAAGTSPLGLPAAAVFSFGSMTLFYYEPRRWDHQPVHEQDEVYVVVKGSGTFALGESEETLERVPFGPGDAIFVPAGTLHRFETFSEDFATWVVMYGPEGGEAAA